MTQLQTINPRGNQSTFGVSWTKQQLNLGVHRD